MTMNQLRERARQLRTQLDMTSKSANPAMFKKLQTELRATERRMEELRGKTKSLSSFWEMFHANVLSGLVLRGFHLLTQAIRGAISTQIDFEQQIANLSSILGKTQEETKQLADEAQRLGAVSRYTKTEIVAQATSLYYKKNLLRHAA